MKCPFCGGDMEHGHLYSYQFNLGFPWYPDGEKPRRYLPKIRTKKNGIMVFGRTKYELEYDAMSFYLCKRCMKGVADKLTEKRKA